MEVVFEPSRAVDFELEVACVIGKGSEMGRPVRIEDADEHIFGLVLLNDWSGEFCPVPIYSALPLPHIFGCINLRPIN